MRVMNPFISIKKKGTSTMEKGTKTKNKKQFIWPAWAKRALCIALLVAVLAGIVVAAIINGGTVLRSRIIVDSKTGKFVFKLHIILLFK
jgi:hypothetical protein